MKVLVATGAVRVSNTEFNWCDENEPVLTPMGACDNDDSCGCAHAWVGVSSLKGATHAQVADVPMSITQFKQLIRDSLVRQGVIPAGRSTQCSPVRRAYFDVIRCAEQHEIGTVLRFTHNGPAVADAAPQEA